MDLQFQCPRCSRAILADASHAGKLATCPKCETSVRIPLSNQESPQLRSAPVLVTHEGRQNSLGIASLILGILAFLFCWIPFLGIVSIPIGGLGFILGLVGLIIAIRRQGSGIGFVIAGSAVSLLAVIIASMMTYAAGKAITDMAEAFDIPSGGSSGYEEGVGPEGSNAVSLPEKESALELVSFRKEMFPQDFSAGRLSDAVQLTLMLKNKTDKRIRAWKALLTVYNSFNEKLFSCELSSGRSDISLGKTEAAHFSWEDNIFINKEPYDYLSGYSAENLKLVLSDVKVVQGGSTRPSGDGTGPRRRK